MTREEFITSCKTAGIGWFNACVKQFDDGKKEIIYVAGTPETHGYNGYKRNTTRAYIWTENTGWRLWFYNLSNHRARIYAQ